MTADTTEKQIRKAQELEKMFKEFEKSNLPVKTFCNEQGIHKSKFYYWKSRYDADGVVGLIDKREGTAHKITDVEKKFIQVTLQERLVLQI